MRRPPASALKSPDGGSFSPVLGLYLLGCVGCGSDNVTSTGDPQTHRCHDCALVWLGTDTLRTLAVRVQLHQQPQLRRAA